MKNTTYVSTAALPVIAARPWGQSPSVLPAVPGTGLPAAGMHTADVLKSAIVGFRTEQGRNPREVRC